MGPIVDVRTHCVCDFRGERSYVRMIPNEFNGEKEREKESVRVCENVCERGREGGKREKESRR